MKSRSVELQVDKDAIIRACDCCTLSMLSTEGLPYGVPMNFGYLDGIVYFHSSMQGKKIDILKTNPQVCISFSTAHELKWQSEKVACSYSMRYKSVLAYGWVEFVEDMNDKVQALNAIMKNYSDKQFKYNDPSLREVCVFKVRVEKFEGRVYGY